MDGACVPAGLAGRVPVYRYNSPVWECARGEVAQPVIPGRVFQLNFPFL